MGNLSEKLGEYSLLGLDTSIFIYHLEAHPMYLTLTQELLSGVEIGRWQAVTSVITLMEIIVRPIQLHRFDIASKYEALLVNYPNLQIVDLGREIVHRAALLRAEFRIRPADALQAAACLVHGAVIFVTNDRRLACLQPLIQVVLLDDLI